MNKTFAFLSAILFAACITVTAQVTNMTTYGANNGTNAGTIVSVSGFYAPPQAFLVQFGPITNGANTGLWPGSYLTNGLTNVLAANLQISVDAANSNWLTLATLTPNGTNGEVDAWKPNLNSFSLPVRVQLVTTNPLSVGVQKTQ